MKKRGKDHNWQIIKYSTNIALYAKCKCGFKYCCSGSKRNEDGSWSIEQVINNIYPYCPWCGAYKKTYDAEVIKKDMWWFDE